MLTPDLLALAEEIAAYYRAPIGTTLAAMLPPGLESRLDRRWEVARPDDLPARPRRRGAMAADDRRCRRSCAPRRAEGGRAAWLERLRRSGAIRAAWSLRPPDVNARRVRVLRPLAGDAEPPRRAPVQRASSRPSAAGSARWPSLPRRSECEPASAPGPGTPARGARPGRARLAHRRARARCAHRSDSRRPAPRACGRAASPRWTRSRGLPPGGELLLEGVAASGKTDVYLAAIAETLAAGRGVIVLGARGEPRPAARRPASARSSATSSAVLHSGLSAGERHDEWWRILRGEARVVVGTRTAAFAPLDASGSSSSTRSTTAATSRTARRATTRAGWPAAAPRWRGARVVLGSATPDLVTLARVRGGHAERARLAERRVGGVPAIEVADLRAELAGGNRSIFSTALADALGALRRGQRAGRPAPQPPRSRHLHPVPRLRREPALPRLRPALRLPPRRAARCAATTAAASSAPTGPLPVVRQRAHPLLRGRHPARRGRAARAASRTCASGGSTPTPSPRGGDSRRSTTTSARAAPTSSSARSSPRRASTSRRSRWPRSSRPTSRSTCPTTGPRSARSSCWPRWPAGPDAGPLPGRVIFQTYAPGHYAVRTAAALDVDGFADEELLRRRLLGYPPFSVLARLLVADADRGRAEERGRQAAAAVAAPGVEVLGPLPSYVARRAGRYRMQVVIRARGRRARAGCPRAGPARRRHRRRSRVAPVNRYNAAPPWPSAAS